MTCTQVRIVTQHAKKTEDYLRLKQKSTMAHFPFLNSSSRYSLLSECPMRTFIFDTRTITFSSQDRLERHILASW